MALEQVLEKVLYELYREIFQAFHFFSFLYRFKVHKIFQSEGWSCVLSIFEGSKTAFKRHILCWITSLMKHWQERTLKFQELFLKFWQLIMKDALITIQKNIFSIFLSEFKILGPDLFLILSSLKYKIAKLI